MSGGPEYGTRLEVRRRLVQRDNVVDMARTLIRRREELRSVIGSTNESESFALRRLEEAADRLERAVGELDK